MASEWAPWKLLTAPGSVVAAEVAAVVGAAAARKVRAHFDGEGDFDGETAEGLSTGDAGGTEA